MTFMSGEAEAAILRQDQRGRVRVPAERREALLDEFERSGASAARFARLAGINYQTFAGWVQKRRQSRATASSPVGEGGCGAGGGPLRLFQALVDDHGAARGSGLVVELPGGSRIILGSPLELELAAELVALIAQRVRGRC